MKRRKKRIDALCTNTFAMKAVLILVEDELAEKLPSWLPEEGAWVLDQRYDEFRCSVHGALLTYRYMPSTCRPYLELMNDLDAWLVAQPQ